MDKALKQRLVGASVLIILAVIVLPMLLSGRSDTLKQESRQIELPQKPTELTFETRRFPVGTPDKATGGNADDAARAREPTSEVTKQDPVTDTLTTADEKTQKPTSVSQSEVDKPGAGPLAEDESSDTETDSDAIQPPVAVAKPPAVATIVIDSPVDRTGSDSVVADDTEGLPRYLVQVASFSSEKRANALASELRAGKMTVVMDVVDRTAGRLHRVRVGPFVKRSDADAIVSQIRKQNSSLSPRVMDMRPGEASPVTTPHDPMVRWAVQVGSFTSAASAEAEVAKLQLSGLAAFSQKVSSADGTTYKVRIGPEISQAKAEELKQRIKAENGIDGFLTTQE